MGDVVVVPLHTLGKRGLTAQAVHLRPAGDSRPDAVAVVVADDVLVEQVAVWRGASAGESGGLYLGDEDSADTGEYVELPFRLTIGLNKTGNQWIIVHEHHSIPAK